MATTYSPNLALTLQGTNDNPGTWGNITNTNLGTLLEQAISGYETQSLTAGTTLTLTIPNGASGVARNMYLEFTGTGSTVIVPSNKKLYFVYNNCSSGTIDFKVAGQTGVTVPNGSKQILVSNGTDIIEAVSPGVEGVTTTNLTAYGVDAGDSITSGANNTAVGYKAGTGITTGSANTFLGFEAGQNVTTSNFNTHLGYDAGANGANVSSNTFVGYLGGYNIGGSGNVGVGGSALQGSGPGNTASSNTGIGFQALLTISTGTQNVAVGNVAGDAITTANWNTCIGSFAGTNVNTGSANTLIGYNSGQGITTGTTNCALGDSAYLTGNYSNSSCIGFDSAVTGSNQVQLGNSSTTTYAYGAVQNRSDARDKTDIRDTQLGLNFILALRPRDFKWDMREDYRTKPPTPPNFADYPSEEAYNEAIAAWKVDYSAWEEANKLANITHDGTHTRTRYHQGLIAQEVKQTMDAMGVDFGGYQDHGIKNGDPVLTIGYDELVAPLIKAIQELKAEFDEYKRTHP